MFIWRLSSGVREFIEKLRTLLQMRRNVFVEFENWLGAVHALRMICAGEFTRVGTQVCGCGRNEDSCITIRHKPAEGYRIFGLDGGLGR